jgi:signal transduction histidine kinase
MKIVLLFSFIAMFGNSFGQSAEIRKTEQALVNIKDSAEYVNALNRIAKLIYEQCVDSEFYYAKKARDIAGRINYEKGVADALTNFGVVYILKGDLELSLRYYNNAYNTYVRLNDTAGRVTVLMNIANVFDEMGEKNKAVRNYRQALALVRKLSTDSIVTLLLTNYLLVYPEDIPKDSLAAYRNWAKQVAIKYHDQSGMVGILQIDAYRYLGALKRDSAALLFDQAVEMCLATGLDYSAVTILDEFGSMFERQDPQRMAAYYSQALTLAESKGFHNYSKYFTSRLYHYYAEAKDSSRAQQYSAKLVQLYETEENFALNSGIDYIDYALKEQALEAEIKNGENRNKFIIVLTVLCALSVITGLFIYKLYLSRRKHAADLDMLNKSIQKALTSLERSHHENTRMMKIAAHDLRGPLGAIVRFSEFLLGEKTELANKKDILLMINSSADNSLALITELLQSNASAVDAHREPVELKNLIQHCTKLMQHKAAEKEQLLVVHAENATIAGDPEKLWRVFSNLIGNAIKFSQKKTSILVDMRLIANTVVILIKDEGIGIPANLADKLFSASPEIKRPGTSGEPSYGLGLSISRQIVEAHNGRLWFESSEGNGTSFYVELPI